MCDLQGKAAEAEEQTAGGRLVRAGGVQTSRQPRQAAALLKCILQGTATSFTAPHDGCLARFVEYKLLSCVLLLQPWEALCTTRCTAVGCRPHVKASRGLESCRDEKGIVIAGETH